MESRPRRLTSATLALAIALHVSRVHAIGANDAAVAEALFEEGKRLMAAKQYATACTKFAESQRLDPGIGTSLWLADCYAKNGQLASAWATFKEGEAIAQKQRDPRAALAREEASKLAPSLSKLTIDVPPAARVPGLELRRDDVVLGPPLWGTPVPSDGGPHRIAASAPHKKRWEGQVIVPREGGSTRIEVPVLEDAPEAPAVAAPIDRVEVDDAGRGQRTLGIVVGGLGVAGLVIGTIFGLQVKPKADEANDQCAGDRCTQAGVDIRNDARALATVSTVSFVAGGALLLAGGVLFFTAPHGRGRTAILAPMMTPGGGGGVLDLRF